MKLTITKIARYTKNKDGDDLVTKDGKSYTRVVLNAQEYGQKQISGFGTQGNASWKAGDTVDVEIEEKGEYLNFKMPKKFDFTGGFTEADRATLNDIKTLGLKLLTMMELLAKPPKDDYPPLTEEDMPTF